MAPPRERPNNARPTVVVADDEPGMRNMLRILLDVEGYTVRVAADGAEALVVAAEVAADLILVDLKMPVLGGAEFCQAYRAGGGTSPVILMTASGANAAEAAADACGAAAYITKPFEIEDVLATIARLVRA